MHSKFVIRPQTSGRKLHHLVFAIRKSTDIWLKVAVNVDSIRSDQYSQNSESHNLLPIDSSLYMGEMVAAYIAMERFL